MTVNNPAIKVAITISIALSLFSCAERTAWYHPTRSNQEFYRDRAYCRSMAGGGGATNTQIYSPQSTSSGFMSGFTQTHNTMSAINAQDEINGIFNDCMLGQGWMLVDASSMSKKGRLGLLVQELPPEYGREGIMVSLVNDNGPAEKAGVVKGDIILECDGNKIKEVRDLTRLVDAAPGGKNVNLIIRRNNKQISLKVELY